MSSVPTKYTHDDLLNLPVQKLINFIIRFKISTLSIVKIQFSKQCDVIYLDTFQSFFLYYKKINYKLKQNVMKNMKISS